ncbi:MAG: hypothetical protein IM597_19085 [Pseudanabaena sp. M176S2SP2A07QC]|nr:hypothetical protein [Pseudanabaena sp. M090S1SP2A07QC]MCA6507099.1 hypothetical protein [Pseudanabaena sp. M172S2SP2A07QC]MCA6521090.1 hypothetical protein [Pseudanabaena sp. M051S1SP2A07QC]MCA6536197.1 hypothetical protein [Pseudanabaena sp. M176S2SP2A07QC]MCA6562314.1 hypothetical protein [Pseudanabaena sp. M079S1SP2A07QC]MCA6566199.1 hypothetical protein [Pseudanabaena sp. M151S2SP2A07QC]MCA6579425.1 hypothetical protein [Pseudanabaena sp. M085S1SP2A07QC]
MAEQSSAIFWVLNCPIYLLRCYSSVLSHQLPNSPDQKTNYSNVSFA